VEIKDDLLVKENTSSKTLDILMIDDK
ncbi:MAG: hypothetical protein K0Q97_2000, partial [Bacillota bacterium]|nr:hypothetical protein [Bacillota bacterium]